MKQKFAIIFALVVGSIVLLSLNQVYGQEQGQYTGQKTIPIPECVETVSPTKVILHIDILVPECSGYQGLVAIAKNTLYFERLGYEPNKDKTVSTFLGKNNEGDSVLVLEKPEVTPEQDKPYKDCLVDTSKTYIECQQFNPRKK
jgi:hypothetical protein